MRHVLGYRTVPAALYERDCTVFISTNTFLNGYARKAHPYGYASCRPSSVTRCSAAKVGIAVARPTCVPLVMGIMMVAFS